MSNIAKSYKLYESKRRLPEAKCPTIYKRIAIITRKNAPYPIPNCFAYPFAFKLAPTKINGRGVVVITQCADIQASRTQPHKTQSD